MTGKETLAEICWDGHLVGFFEFLALDGPNLIGYWAAADTPQAPPFLVAVRNRALPVVRLGRGTGWSGLFLVRGIEPGRKRSGDAVADVDVITLAPVISSTTGTRLQRLANGDRT